jgi:hypothetical protein
MRFCECFGIAEGGTLEASLYGGNAWLPSFLLCRYTVRLLFCVASCSY